MKLHDYQLRMAEHMVEHRGAMCWSEVGLGKTAATLQALRMMKARGEPIQVLIVAPKRVSEHVWEAERDLWAPKMPMLVIKGNPAQRLRALRTPCAVKVIGRDNVKWLVDELKERWPFNVLVVDESQGFKSPSTARFKALRRVKFDRVILLSATPASEGLLGLWSQCYLADRGERLGKTYTAYTNAFFVGDYMGWNLTPRPNAEKEIHARVKDITVAMRAEDYLDLPERVNSNTVVEMLPGELRVYEQLRRDALLPIANGEPITAANAAVLWGKLHQLSGGAIYDEGKDVHVFSNAKLAGLQDVIEGANGNPVLVFYGYRHEIDRIQAATGAELLDVDRWNAGLQKVALAHPDSCGAGLNLQHGGSIAVWFTLPARLGQYIQACGRLHRQGQTRPVFLHHLVVAGTTDEVVLARLGEKSTTQVELLRAMVRPA